MIDMKQIFQNIINDEIKKIDETKLLYESILKDDNILNKLNTISSFKNVNITYDESVDLDFFEINKLFTNSELGKTCSFKFDFKQSAEGEDILIELLYLDMGALHYYDEGIYAAPYFIKDNNKFYSNEAILFISFENLAINSEFLKEIRRSFPKSFSNKKIKKIATNALDEYLNDESDIRLFKEMSLDENDDFEKMIQESINKRISKEIFK